MRVVIPSVPHSGTQTVKAVIQLLEVEVKFIHINSPVWHYLHYEDWEEWPDTVFVLPQRDPADVYRSTYFRAKYLGNWALFDALEELFERTELIEQKEDVMRFPIDKSLDNTFWQTLVDFTGTRPEVWQVAQNHAFIQNLPRLGARIKNPHEPELTLPPWILTARQAWNYTGV